MKAEDIEQLLGLGYGAFEHIPKYCRESAMEAIAHVRKLEKERLFRPGVYYVALADLSGATAASAVLGMELNRHRVESFITLCVESLGQSSPENYAHFLKPVGDASLMLFSSFTDLYRWWDTTQNRMRLYSFEWNKNLAPEQRNFFQLRSKTVVHVGEISYSDNRDPVSAAVNQVFKIEKLFKAGELGCTETAKAVASPLFPDLSIEPALRSAVDLPGLSEPQMTWLLSKNESAEYELA